MLPGAKARPFPGFIEPCAPILRKAPPVGDGWVHEIKHDGYRAQAQFDRTARVYTRRGNDWADRMPSIVAAIASLPANNIVLDGELVAIDTKGKPDFHALQSALARGSRSPASLVYFAFDLLHLDGFDLRAAPLLERKRVLSELLVSAGAKAERLIYCDHIEGDGATILDSACALGLEGIVSKLAASPYRSGRRPEWVKTKCAAWTVANRQRFQQLSGQT
jgi:bifunctional non-homologous end joining protein LigD